MAEELRPEIERRKSERKTRERNIEYLRGKAAKAKGSEFDKLAADIADLEASLPDIPNAPRLWAQDVTPEKLAALMALRKGGIASLSDEGGIFEMMAGKYSKGTPNLDVYLHGHSGDAVRVDRIGRDAVVIDAALLTVGITPQPDVIGCLSTTPEFRGRGLLARFLYFMPPSNIGTRTGDGPTIPDAVRREYHATIRAILDYPFAIKDDETPCTHTLKLSREGVNAWRGFASGIESQMAEGGKYAHIKDWASKFPGAIARIAGLIHIARHAGRGVPQEIAGDDMTAAITMADALAAHALKAFDHMGADNALEGARAILKWARRECRATFTRRDVQRANKHSFRRSDELDAPLRVLEERGHIRMRRTASAPSGGRPSDVISVNPLAL